MEKERRVLDFYCFCNKLKDVVRTGWINWKVNRKRVESVAEHIFGVQMLAIAMWSEYKYNIDIKKVVLMLALHETEEILIGDITPYDKNRDEKMLKGHIAVKEIFSCLENAEEIEDLIYEFDERKTNEAKFAYFCDKLECDLQAKLYDEQNCVDINNQLDNPTSKIDRVVEMFGEGKSFSTMWMTINREKNNYDKNFSDMSFYAMTHKIKK